MVIAIAVGRKIELPDEGVHTPDGFLFHHVGTVHLNKEQITRLQEYGIGYRVGGHFTPEEDEVIRNNWTKFAADNGLDPATVLLYCGKGDRKDQQFGSEVSRRHFCLETNFWPKMCHGLPHRSGNMVKRRMTRIFDPAVVAGHAEIRVRVKWSESEIKELVKQHTACHGDLNAVAERVKKPYVACYNAYQRYLQQCRPIAGEQWKTLWDEICNQTEYPIVTLLRKAIHKQDREQLERVTEIIDFEKVAEKTARHVENCRSAWKEILEQLLKEYEVERPKFEHKKQAWVATIKKVMKIRRPITPKQYATFLRLASKCLVEEDDRTSVLFKTQHVDLERLTHKMAKKGITDFHTGKTTGSEVEYLVMKTRRMLSRCEMHILSRLVNKYTIKERIQIAYGAIDRQLADVPKARKGRTTSFHTHNGFAFVSRWAYLESLIVFTKQLDDNWIPPSKFKKYVKNKDVLALFSEERDNSALVANEEHRKLLQEYEELPSDGEGEEDGERMEFEEES